MSQKWTDTRNELPPKQENDFSVNVKIKFGNKTGIGYYDFYVEKWYRHIKARDSVTLQETPPVIGWMLLPKKPKS